MQLSGSLVPKRPLRLALVVSRFNELVTTRLLQGALDALVRHDVPEDRCDVVWVPGAFELPLATTRLFATNRYDGVICLGAVIRGGTPHFEYVAAEAVKGIAHATLAAGRPVGFGILTTDTLEQALERAGSKHGNKGADAALTVLEMISVLDSIDDLAK